MTSLNSLKLKYNTFEVFNDSSNSSIVTKPETSETDDADDEEFDSEVQYINDKIKHIQKEIKELIERQVQYNPFASLSFYLFRLSYCKLTTSVEAKRQKICHSVSHLFLQDREDRLKRQPLLFSLRSRRLYRLTVR